MKRYFIFLIFLVVCFFSAILLQNQLSTWLRILLADIPRMLSAVIAGIFPGVILAGVISASRTGRRITFSVLAVISVLAFLVAWYNGGTGYGPLWAVIVVFHGVAGLWAGLSLGCFVLEEKPIQLLFSFNGRITREMYWLYCFIPISIITIFSKFNKFVSPNEAIIAMLIFAWPLLALHVKRWHDLDKSGWWQLLNVIPVVGSLYSVIMWGFIKGSEGSNSYGDEPARQS